MIGPMSLANIPLQTVTVLRLPASSVTPLMTATGDHLIGFFVPKA